MAYLLHKCQRGCFGTNILALNGDYLNLKLWTFLGKVENCSDEVTKKPLNMSSHRLEST